MQSLSNSERKYGLVAIALHWAMALLLLALVVLGIYMVRLPDVGYDQVKITLILVHKALGVLAMFAMLLRLAWRVGNALPELVDGLPQWQQVAARFVHLAMYALMLALPMTGWLMSSAGGYPVPFFNWFDLPDFIAFNEYWFRLYIAIHRWLAYALMLVVALHVGAALRHHWLLKDDTLRRMLPGR